MTGRKLKESGDPAWREGVEFTFPNVKLMSGCLRGNFISKTVGQMGGKGLGVNDLEVTVYWKKGCGENSVRD